MGVFVPIIAVLLAVGWLVVRAKERARRADEERKAAQRSVVVDEYQKKRKAGKASATKVHAVRDRVSASEESQPADG